jgi:inner membrane transporter RhtA
MDRPQTRSDEPAPAVAAVLLAMVSLMAGASLAKGIFPVTGPLGAAAARLVLAAVILTAIGRPWGSLPRRLHPPLLAYGASLAGMNVFIYQAMARGPIGPAVALEFTGPLAVAVLGSRRPLDLVWVALAAVGVTALVARPGDALDPAGAGFALGAGAFWALYIVAGRRVAADTAGGSAVALGMLVAAALVLPAAVVAEGGRMFTPAALPTAAAVAVLSSVVPYSLELAALRRLEPRTFGVLMSLEPALGAVAGTVMLGERLTPAQWAAVGAVVLASAGSAVAVRGKAAGTVGLPPATP